MGSTSKKICVRFPGAEWAAHETKHDNYCWANAAYAMAANIAKTFHETAFCVAIAARREEARSRGCPLTPSRPTMAGWTPSAPTEIAICQRREAELGRLGFLPLSHWVGTDFAAFVGSQSLQKPQQYSNPAATTNAELSARLPYVFLVSRFAHYLKK